MNDTLKKMHSLACQARQNAYAPYSNFQVGACLLTEDNQFFTGCNVENAAYSTTQCAEINAIGNMISQGGNKQKIASVMIVAGGPDACTPCGNCRQALIEFSSPDIVIHIGNTETIRENMGLGTLLPFAFHLKEE